MAKRKIIWTEKAQSDRKQIFTYWNNRNKSNTFSIKLNKLINNELNLVSINPYIGKKTDIQHIYVRVIRDYLIFYQIMDQEILVLTIWDGRRAPEKLTLNV